MSTPITTRARAVVAWWGAITRWDVKAQNTVTWQWPADQLRPLLAALTRLHLPVVRSGRQVGSHQLLTIRFDGSLTARNAPDVVAQFKGQLFAAPPGTVVYSKIDARNGAIGIVPPTLTAAAVSSEYPVYQINPAVASPEYIRVLFRSAPFRRLINALVSGSSGRKRVEPKALETLVVPLPSLTTQAAIVAGYEAGQQQVAALRAEADKAENAAAASVLNSVFTDTAAIRRPSGPRRKCVILAWSETQRWSLEYVNRMVGSATRQFHFPTAPLGHLTQGRSGGTPSKRDPRFWQQGTIPWVSPKDMKRYELHTAEDLITEAAVAASSAPIIAANSVLLVVRSGIQQRLVPVAVNRVPVSINQDLRAFTVTDERLLPDFVGLYLSLSQAKLLGLVKTSVTVESINKEELEGFPIPLPPLELQAQLVATYFASRTTSATLRQQAAAQEAATRATVEGMILGTLILQADATESATK